MKFYPREIKLKLYRDGWNFYFCNECSDKFEKRWKDVFGLTNEEVVEACKEEIYRAQRELNIEDCESCSPERHCPDHGASLVGGFD